MRKKLKKTKKGSFKFSQSYQIHFEKEINYAKNDLKESPVSFYKTKQVKLSD